MKNLGINIIRNHEVFKNEYVTSYFCGSAFLNGERFDHSTTDFSAIAPVVNRLNGFFSWVIVFEDRAYVVVDRVRSIPIFYTFDSSEIFITDSPRSVIKEQRKISFGSRMESDFQLAGFVPGSDTLIDGLYQIPAGTILEIQYGSDNSFVREASYYRFTHSSQDDVSDTQLLADLDKSVSNAVSRLIEYAAGRQIVVPLSGGFDSRLLVTQLRKQGYDKVVTFTYGVKGNKESRYSKRVAESLGLEWMFIEYSPESWRKFWESTERREFQLFASGFCSLPHIQDALALSIIRENGAVEADCVFVPGHSADFVAGSHIPSFVFQRNKFSRAELLKSIFDKHFGLAPTTETCSSQKQVISSLDSDVPGFGDTWLSAEDFADSFEEWDWRERQAKFIVNSVRAYEFFGFAWWMPFWDNEFVEFWGAVPLRLREGRYWYIDYVKHTYSVESGQGNASSLGNGGSSAAKSVKLLKARVKRRFPRVHNFLWYLYKRQYNRQSPVGLSGRVVEERVQQLLARGYKINGVDAKVFLEDLKAEYSDAGG